MDETENTTWLLDATDPVHHKIARGEVNSLTTLERLLRSLWAVDYCIWNAGDLVQAHLISVDWQSDGLSAGLALQLPAAIAAFTMPIPELEERYYDELRNEIFEEIRQLSAQTKAVEPYGDPVSGDH